MHGRINRKDGTTRTTWYCQNCQRDRMLNRHNQDHAKAKHKYPSIELQQMIAEGVASNNRLINKYSKGVTSCQKVKHFA